jgi:glycosyltransferase involved in cell wall biosynthesis
MSIDVTVVIPAYNRPEALRRAVESVVAQDLPFADYEVIVVDGSSNPQTAAAVEELQKTSACALRLVTKRPEGPGPSRNVGARLGRGRVIAFMDCDCQAISSWLRAGLAAFAGRDDVGLVEGRVLPDPTRPFGVFSRSLRIESESFLYETANIFYRREAFEAAGGFPADLNPTAPTPMGGEDADLAWRVKRLGWASQFAPSALVYHEIVPVAPWRWVYTKQLFIFPWMLRQIPELRAFFYGRYFYDKPQAALVVALTGAAVSPWFPLALVAVLPYCVIRAAEPTQTLRGPLRVFRVAAYFIKDLTNCLTLVAGSLRFRRVLI